MKENSTSLLKTAATIVGTIAALGAWLLPGGIRSWRIESEGSPSRVVQTQKAPGAPNLNSPAESPKVEPSTAHRKAEESGRADKTNGWRPQEFGLADGEQKILLSSRVGLAVEFTEVSGVGFVTLRINVDDQSTPYAISHSGERIKFRCAGNDYYASVLSIDDSAERKVWLRVDRAP